MPIANIIDKRKRKYCFFPITAVIEPAYMNNDLPESDQYDENDDRISTCFEERPDTSIYLAINWANQFSFPVTLYLYDFGSGDDGGVHSEFVEELQMAFRELSET